jgi:prephenate dehydratase
VTRVAFQGERGSYSEQAAAAVFGETDLLPCAKLRDVFDAVTAGRADRAVVPVENSQAGSINEAYDLLLTYALFITAEYDLRVRHCLLILPGQTAADIKKVYSHPQALAQCDAYLREHALEPVPTYDTAGSAKMLAEQRLTGAAAIAGRRAAQIYGLEILADGIETNPFNYTKFFGLAAAAVPRAAQSKTSVVFTTQNIPGALHRALGALATRSINLAKIESRPRRAVPWEYLFYVDFDGHRDDPPVAEALKDLAEVTTFLRVLGSYPKSPPRLE